MPFIYQRREELAAKRGRVVTGSCFRVKSACMNAEPGRSDTPLSDNGSGKTDERETQAGSASSSGEQSASAGLTKEEQWALFEKELKESDWGHQPC
jgi:hypothetical protein